MTRIHRKIHHLLWLLLAPLLIGLVVLNLPSDQVAASANEVPPAAVIAVFPPVED